MFKVVCFNFLSSILVRISSNKCEIQQLKSNLSLYICVFFFILRKLRFQLRVKSF